MSIYTIREVNVTTGEEVERKATAQEIAQFKKDEIASNALKLEAEEKAAKRAQLLERLGLTEDEARILLG